LGPPWGKGAALHAELLEQLNELFEETDGVSVSTATVSRNIRPSPTS